MTRYSASCFLSLSLLLVAGCPPPGSRFAMDPKHVVDGARDKDLPKDGQALRALADQIVDSKPEKAASYDHALAALEQALEKQPDSYDLLWRAARACFLVTEYLPDTDKQRHLAYAQAGRDYGEQARKDQPKRIEGRYYFALNQSKFAEAKNNLRLIKPALDEAEAAIKIEPGFDNAGPLRLAGKIYIMAPAWPVSVGSPDKAVELLERAVSMAPLPLNRLFLGEAYFHEEDFAKAKAAIEQALKEGKGSLHPRWQKEGEDYLRRVKAKTSS